MVEFRYVPDLFGGVTLVAGSRGLSAIRFGDLPGESSAQLLIETERQLREYAEGARFLFDLPLDPAGTAFQLEV